MKTLLSLLLLAAVPATSYAQAPVRANGPSAGRVVPLRYVQNPAPKSSLRQRLDAIRLQHASRPSARLSPVEEARRERLMRPMIEDSMGSFGRRKSLGGRKFTSSSDVRLGSKWRRELLSGRPIRGLTTSRRR